MIFTFGIKYSKEKYPYKSFNGSRLVMPEYKDWYGGTVKFVMKGGPIVLFVGENGTLDAGVLKEDLDKCDIKDLRQLYQNKFGEEAPRVAQKPTIIERLTGESR